MKTSKLLIERVMTRQYWEKRHARDKYRLEQGFSKYLNGSSVSRSPTTTALPNNQTQSSKTSRFDRAKCRRLPTKIYYQPQENFFPEMYVMLPDFPQSFPSNALLWTRHLSLFRKKCDHKMVAVEPSLHRCDYCCHKTFQALSSLQFSTLGGVTKQLRARRIHAGTPPSETNLHFQSFSGYVLSVCLSLPNGLEYNLFRDQNQRNIFWLHFMHLLINEWIPTGFELFMHEHQCMASVRNPICSP